MGKYVVSLGEDVFTVVSAFEKAAEKGALSVLKQIATSSKTSIGAWDLTAKEQSSFWEGVQDFAKGLIPFKGTYDAARETIDSSRQIYNIKNEELLKEIN